MIKKVSILGSGAVGSSLAFNLLSRLKLEDLVLIDIASELAKGTALDLEDTRAFLKFSTKISAGNDYALIKNSDIVVLTAGVARKEGMSRLDLLKINAKVARELAQKIKSLAASSIVIVITNPLDLITYIVAKETGFDRSRVLGMGSSLDSARLINLLSAASNLGVDSLEGFVFGLHNNEMIVSPQRIKIKGKTLDEYLDAQLLNSLKEHTAKRGGEIVGFLKNKSAHFAPGLAACSLIEAIVADANTVIPVSVLLNGEYGLKDVCVGVPCVINKKGAEKIIELKLDKEEQQKLEKAKKEFAEINSLELR